MTTDVNDQSLDAQLEEQPEVTIPEGGGSADEREDWKTEYEKLSQKLDMALEEIKRTRQSFGDQNKALKERIAKDLAELDEYKAATGLSDKKYQEMADNIREKAISESKEQKEQVAQPVQPAQGRNEPQLSKAEAVALELGVSKIHAELGLPLFREDKEFKELQKIERSRNLSLEEYLDEYQKAVERKALREGVVVQSDSGRSPMARIPGRGGASTGNNPYENVNDPHTLINEGLKRMGQRR